MGGDDGGILCPAPPLPTTEGIDGALDALGEREKKEKNDVEALRGCGAASMAEALRGCGAASMAGGYESLRLISATMSAGEGSSARDLRGDRGDDGAVDRGDDGAGLPLPPKGPGSENLLSEGIKGLQARRQISAFTCDDLVATDASSQSESPKKR